MTPLATLLKLERPIVVIDCETTGVNVDRDRVIELAIYRVGCDGVVTTDFERRFNPGIPIPPEATAVHGITDADVAGCGPFASDALGLAIQVRGCDVIGYNGDFDRRILSAEFARAGVSPSPFRDSRLIDPCRIFHRREPRDLTAAALKYCGVDHSGAHGAADDARMTLRVLEAQLTRYDLPTTVAELAAYCENRDPSWIDSTGKLVWRNGEACIGFGKNVGVPLKVVARSDRSFLDWMLAKDFPDDTKRIVREALRGVYPVKPQTPEAVAHGS